MQVTEGIRTLQIIVFKGPKGEQRGVQSLGGKLCATNWNEDNRKKIIGSGGWRRWWVELEACWVGSTFENGRLESGSCRKDDWRCGDRWLSQADCSATSLSLEENLPLAGCGRRKSPQRKNGVFCNVAFLSFHRLKIYTGMEWTQLNNIQKQSL